MLDSERHRCRKLVKQCFKMKIAKNADELDVSDYPARKEWPAEFIVAVTLLLIFTAAATLLLSAHNHFSIYFTSSSDRFFPKTLYKAREAKKCSSIDNLVEPPTDLMHNMTDEELLWRASVEVKREGYPFKRVPKVAFMFLTRGALPFQKLWERLFKGHEGLYSVYVHPVPGYKLVASKGSAFYGRQIPSQEVQWGSTSLLDAERRLLANALLDFSNEHFILLSESCIPLYNFTTIYNYITSSPHCFLESYDEDSRDARGRYRPQLAPEVTVEQWRKGSAWFEVSRKVAVSIVAEIKYYNLFHKYCYFAPCFPDEHYIPTYIGMFHGALIANRTVTWVDFSRGGFHPASFGGESITEGFIQSLRNKNDNFCNLKTTPGCFLFARKFSPSALEPLLNLSSTVLGIRV